MANSPKRVTVDVGSVIADTYTIEALLGEGGMGQVFLASHLRLPGKQVAIKLLHGGLEDADILRRFAREAEIASRLGHPNIVGVVDTNLLPDGTPYLVLEYLQGESLAQRLKRGPLPLPQVLSLVRQIGSALAAAHREGIVHRDLKPQNIFLCPTEVDGRLVEIAKVLDFGISKIRGSDTVKTLESSLLGTPQYMAPEQATGQHSAVDERTDIFALGAILYEMFTGYPAFAGASIPEVVFKVVYEHPTPLEQVAPELPANVVAAVTRAMAKPAQDRFASVSELVEALTGTPLATLTAPPGTRADFALTEGATHPPASRRGEDAFANTMDSGKLDPAPTPIPPPVIPITPHSPTLRSLGSAPGSTKPAVFTSSIRQPASFDRDQRVIATVPQMVPAPRRSRVAILAIALGAATIAAIVMVVVMRDDRPAAAPPGDAARVAEVAVDAASVPDAAIVVLDAGIVDARVAPPDARKPPPRDAGVKPDVRPIEPDPPDVPENATLAQTLRNAEAATPAQAKMLANQVIDAGDPGASPRASRRQLARAHAIRGAAACKTADLGDAKSDLAALTRLRRATPALGTFRARMLASCHADHQLLGVK